MPQRFSDMQERLRRAPKTWAITGVAGFIGSNLLESLLLLDQHVVGMDNFATGHQRNLDEVRTYVSAEQWARFRFFQGDTGDLTTCQNLCTRTDFVLHQAALGSVPRSLQDPIATNQANINGFLNMLVAARDAGVQRFVYAGSSSTYGDHPALPKVENVIGKPLSPYAVTKYVNELYADVFSRCYELPTIGLRYFNVFGPRQDPNGPYAAVIPKWITAMLADNPITIHGDGETSRDFCFVKNVVQANLLAATTSASEANNQIYNVALGDRTTLNELLDLLRKALAGQGVNYQHAPVYADFRSGDVRHSQASIDKAETLLGYHPAFRIADGIRLAMPWYVSHQH